MTPSRTIHNTFGFAVEDAVGEKGEVRKALVIQHVVMVGGQAIVTHEDAFIFEDEHAKKVSDEMRPSGLVTASPIDIRTAGGNGGGRPRSA